MTRDVIMRYIVRLIVSTLCIYCVIIIYHILFISNLYQSNTPNSSYEIYEAWKSRDENDIRVALKRYPRILVSYVAYAPLHSSDEVHLLCLSNMDFFLQFGVVNRVIESDYNIDYIFHLIGNTEIPGRLKTLCESYSNIKITTGIKHSVDLYAHGDAIGKYLDSYDLFVFLNCGSRGPYYPLASKTSKLEATTLWLLPFLERMNNGIKVVGPTISCEIHPHIQSYAMVMDRDAAATAYSYWSNPLNISRLDIIDKSEVGLSRKYLELGYGIASLDTRHLGRNFFKIQICDPEFDKVAGNSFFANPVSCRHKSTRTKANLAGCLGQQPCEVGFIKNGGEVVKLNVYPIVTKGNIIAEEKYIHGKHPQLCLHPVYPNKPYLSTNISGHEYWSPSLLDVDSKHLSGSKFIFIPLQTDFGNPSTLNAILSYLRDEKSSNSIFPADSVLLLGVVDQSNVPVEMKNELAKVLESRSRISYAFVSLPNYIHHQLSAYSSQLCKEEWKYKVMTSGSENKNDDDDFTQDCTLPIQYFLMDVVLQYFQDHECLNCQVAFILNFQKYMDFMFLSNKKALFELFRNPKLNILRHAKTILAFSLPVKTIVNRSSSRTLSFWAQLPRRPTINDYKVATVKILTTIS